MAGDQISDEMVDAYVRAIFTDWYIEMKGEELQQDVRAGLAAALPLIRAQVAAELVAEARELQASIDHPGTDADAISSLIDEAEGLWSAICVVDEATWRRECEQPPYVRPEPDEPVAEAGPMHPALAAALARAKAQVDAAHEPSDRGQTADALVALGQDSTTDTIPN